MDCGKKINDGKSFTVNFHTFSILTSLGLLLCIFQWILKCCDIWEQLEGKEMYVALYSKQ